MVYISAAQVTNGQGYTIRGIDYHNLQTVDVTGVKLDIWKEQPEVWENYTIGKILWLGEQDTVYLRSRSLIWIRKYHALAFYLKDKYSTFEHVRIAKNFRCRVIKCAGFEYRVRGCVIHCRKDKKRLPE